MIKRILAAVAAALVFAQMANAASVDVWDPITQKFYTASTAYPLPNYDSNLYGLLNAATSPTSYSTVAINVSTATTTQLIALSGTKSIYVLGIDVIVAAAAGITFEYGTGTNCGTGTIALSGKQSFAANGGEVWSYGGLPILVAPSGTALCIVTDSAVQYSGAITYQQF